MELSDKISKWNISLSPGFTARDKEIIEKINGVSSRESILPYHHYISENIVKYSSNIAVHGEKRDYTYKEFFDKARAVSYHISIRYKQGSRVAVLMGKGSELIVSALGIALAGCVYAPLDSDFSKDSVMYCLKNMSPACIMADKRWRELLRDSGYDVVCMDDIDFNGGRDFDFRSVGLDDPFCIIHTSGSTGFPKGVEINQRGLISCLLYTNRLFGADYSDCVLSLTNHCHDMSLYDIFGIFLCGGAVAVIEHSHWKDPFIWSIIIERAGVTIWNSVPSFLELYIETMPEEAEASIKQLKVIIHGGDYFKPSHAERILTINPGCRVFNSGGPTETTLWNIYHQVTREDAASGLIPYGVPFPDTEYYILGDNNELLPTEQVGIMYVCGVGTAKGYIGGRDHDRFIAAEDGSTLYNTGDTGYYSGNGYIVFKGRMDTQIKRYGKRIELDGIKKCALGFRDITDAAVAAYGDNNRTICLFYSSSEAIGETVLRSYLSETLPDYMLPNRYIRVNRIPYTNNGKPDIKRLLKEYCEQ